MLVAEYAEKSRSVAHYHDKAPNANFTYPALGICGEVGEVVDKLTDGKLRETSEVVAELGDVLWYVNNTAIDLGFTLFDLLEDVSLLELDGLSVSDFNSMAKSVAVKSDHRFEYVLLVVYAGRIAEIAKKTIRDTSGSISEERRQLVRDHLGGILCGLYALTIPLGVTMDDVAQANIDKLFSRRDRGVLSGDGDNR